MSIRPIDSVGISPRSPKPTALETTLARVEGEPARVTEFFALNADVVRADSTTHDSPDRASRDEGHRGKGVLRLLEAGHFKGVADVRLKINFHDELAARAQASTGPVIENGLNELTAKLDGGLASLAADLGLDEASTESVESLLVAFSDQLASAGDALDAGSLATAIESAFDTLVSQLRDTLSGSNNDVSLQNTVPSVDPNGSLATDTISAATVDRSAPTISETVAAIDEVAGLTGSSRIDKTVGANVDDVEDIAADIGAAPDDTSNTTLATDDALASLTALFRQALEAFLVSLDVSPGVLDPAPYDGNGAAYDKFLAQYDALRTGDSTLNERA